MAQQHGTNRGYQQHYRAGEEPCQDCREAHRAYRAGLRAKEAAAAAADYGEALDTEQPVEEPLNVLADHRENLRIVRAAMSKPGAVRNLAGLSKRRAELVNAIATAEAAARPQPTLRDQIAERRRARLEVQPDG